MGCGTSSKHSSAPQLSTQESSGFAMRILRKRREFVLTDDYPVSTSGIDQQATSLCAANLRSSFGTHHSQNIRKTKRLNHRIGTQDSRFIEQRIYIETGGEDCNEATTNEVTTNEANPTTVTKSTVISNKALDVNANDKSVVGNPNQNKSFFCIAMNHNERLEAIKRFEPQKYESSSPATFIKIEPEKSPAKLSEPPAAIVQHITRTEFLENLNSIEILPPAPIRKAITPIRGSIQGSRETLMSERSFIVVHNILKVAWEKESCHERIEEQKRRQCSKKAHLRWHSVDSSCTGSSGSSSTDSPDVSLGFGTNRAEWSRTLYEIVQLD